MADETKVRIKAKVAQKIINDGDTSYLPLKGELVAIKKGDNISLAIGQGNEDSAELQELNYIEGPASDFYITAGKDPNSTIGDYATAEGYSTIANHRSQNVFGEYNIADDKQGTEKDRGTYIEIVGNGDETTRSNARTLDWEGNERLKGKLIVNWVKCDTSSEQATLEENNKVVTYQQYKQLVSHEANGLAPKVNTENSGTNLVLTAKYEDGTTVLSWQVLGAGVTIPVVDSGNDGLAPAFGTNDPEDTVLVIKKDTDNTFRPKWVKAVQLKNLTGYSGDDAQFLVSNNNVMRWESLIDGDSYGKLKRAINNPINFIS